MPHRGYAAEDHWERELNAESANPSRFHEMKQVHKGASQAVVLVTKTPGPLSRLRSGSSSALG
ncbi:MAG: hypothetical protein QW587_12060 [Candidatus Bathyarchaeia archaeon]